MQSRLRKKTGKQEIRFERHGVGGWGNEKAGDGAKKKKKEAEIGVAAVSQARRAALPLRLTSNTASVGLCCVLVLIKGERRNRLCTHSKVACTSCGCSSGNHQLCESRRGTKGLQQWHWSLVLITTLTSHLCLNHPENADSCPT